MILFPEMHQEIAEKLGVNDKGKINGTGKGRGDWLQRFGLSTPPITLRQPIVMTVTHKVLKSQNVVYLNIKGYRANSIFYGSSICFEIALKGIVLNVIQIDMHQYAQINMDKLIIRVLS